MTDPPRRRTSDKVEPEVLLAIEERAAENRHVLRGEMAEALLRLEGAIGAVRQDVQVGNLQSVTETAKTQSTLEELKREFAGVRHDVDELQHEVETLKAKSLATAELERFKRIMVATAVSLAGVVVAATGVLLAYAH